MENEIPHTTHINRQEGLAPFRSEIAELRMLEKKELEEKRGTSNHLERCNPDELAKGDQDLYKKYKSNDLTAEELYEYRNKSEKRLNPSQIVFAEYLANMLQRQISNKFLGK